MKHYRDENQQRNIARCKAEYGDSTSPLRFNKFDVASEPANPDFNWIETQCKRQQNIEQ
jgi:hypothetical protein